MSHRLNLPELPQVDVELVLEGSYPYVTGGVSSWAQSLIEGLPEITFGIVHMAAKPEDATKIKYKLPANVLYLHNIFLHDPVFLENKQDKSPDETEKNSFFHGVFDLHFSTKKAVPSNIKKIVSKLCSRSGQLHFKALFYGEKAFSLLLALYQKGFSRSSFLDFFWTWRYMHIPMFQIFQAKKGPAKIVHSACTGYAGFYAMVRKINEDIPVILTEHGIYTRERAIEIIKSEAIYSEERDEHEVKLEYGVFKRLWLSFFEVIGLWAYQMSDSIFTLFEGNRQAQISLGADSSKIEIIPNGVRTENFLNLRHKRPPDKNAIQVGFVGRIVSIKDIKTLLRAFKLVTLNAPNSFLHLIGPIDEELEYSQAMQRLAYDLGIADNIKFHGAQNVLGFYPKLDVCVLTSISEGQPLILLEAMAAGIPVVATSVGACRELINGRTREDQKLGPCGLLTNIAAPDETAKAILSICENPETFQKFAEAGVKRATQFYQQKKVIEKYKQVYLRWLKIKEKEDS